MTVQAYRVHAVEPDPAPLHAGGGVKPEDGDRPLMAEVWGGGNVRNVLERENEDSPSVRVEGDERADGGIAEHDATNGTPRDGVPEPDLAATCAGEPTPVR